VVVIVPPGKDGKAITWVYSLDTETWKTAQPQAPVGGRSSSGYFDYDSRARRCVLYNGEARPPFWLYDVGANQWTPAQTAGEQPPGGYVIGYYDPERDVLVHYNSRDVWVCRLKPAAK
jgi:hypothetical protein